MKKVVDVFVIDFFQKKKKRIYIYINKMRQCNSLFNDQLKISIVE